MDHVEEGGETIHVVELSGEGGGEVEAEAVHVHLKDPVAQAVHDQLEGAGMGHVERVAAPRVVHAVAGAVREQPVVRGVVDAAEGQGRSQMIALRRVVVHDVEDDLDARLVEGLDHGLELGHLLARAVGGGEARVGGKKSDGVVSPVVREPALHQVPVGN
jgi:hypothetical protein